MTVLAAARVVTGEEVLSPGWVEYAGASITGIGVGRPERVDRDLADGIIVPGFVDQHVHGGGGGSFTDGALESALRAVHTHRRHGTTTMMASLVTAGPEELLRSVGMLTELVEDGVIAGIHLEGPWISPSRCGAHDPRHLRHPDPDEIGRLLAAGRGAIAMVTLAPELPGGREAIRQVVDAGVIAAVGHTDADLDQVQAAIDAGARVATHLFNAMPPIHHRQPGPIVALLDDPRVTLELIADGTHLHPALYHYVSGAVGPDRIALVTDAMAAATLGDGTYELGSMSVTVVDGVARIAGGETIAGSTTTMDQLFRAACFAPRDAAGHETSSVATTDEALLRAVRQTSVNPARTLGRADVGSLAAGRRADLVLLDDRLDLVEVISSSSSR